ncbi:MAG: methionine adenosyltransferase domain-containing protein, partial [Gemmatimonadota bacterium]|nr:methionine adenosyltransferase domain-containing protein [Gemmatimonadota bacterium]
VRAVFDLTPGGIIKALDLRRPIYGPTAAYGHFGRQPYRKGGLQFFPWELTNRVEALRRAIR